MSKELGRLETQPSDHFLNAAVDCHLRMSNVVQVGPSFCRLKLLFEEVSLIHHWFAGQIIGHCEQQTNEMEAFDV